MTQIDVVAPGTSKRRARAELYRQRLSRTLALQRRRYDLQQVKHPTVPLDPPVRYGWERYWVVAPQWRRSPEGPLLERALQLVQLVEHSHRRDFAIRDWRRGGKKRPRPHMMRRIDAGTYEVMTTAMKRLFALCLTRDHNGTLRPIEYAVAHPYKYVSRLRPYYLTHRTVPNGDIETELKRISQAQYEYGQMDRWRCREYGGYFDGWSSAEYARVEQIKAARRGGAMTDVLTGDTSQE